MADLTCWGDLLAAGQGMPQSAVIAVFIGPDQVTATIRPMIGGFCIDTGAVIPKAVIEEAPQMQDTPFLRSLGDADAPVPLDPNAVL